MLGRDMIVPPHAAWRWAAFGRPVARREVWRVGCSHGVLTRAERCGGGGRVGRTVVAWLGAVVVARWVVTRVGGDKCPKPRESKIDTTGAGAGCAPGRGGVW